jgi:hypothetical protein
VLSQRIFSGPQIGPLGGASLLALVVACPIPAAKAQQPFFFHEPPTHHFQGPDPFEPRQVREPRDPLEARRPRESRSRSEARRPADVRDRGDARRTRALREPPAPRQSGPATKQAAIRPTEKTKEAPPPPGPHMLIVSVKSQNVSFYANGKLVSQAPVSTGRATHPTPHGVFSIIQRNRHHRSNIYSGAPMPYMQRLTWSGIALHEGVLPGHPASHGCIRLPEHYASYLWRTIKLNTRVIVSREDVAPFEVAHKLLFQPKPVPATADSVPELRKTLDTTTEGRVRTADAMTIATDGADAKSAEAAIEVSATKPAMRDLTTSIEQASAQDAPAPSGPELAGEKPATDDIKADATASIYPRPADIPAPILASFVQSLDNKQKMAAPKGPISVFISKKDKRLYVRQHFIPLFSAPVTFKDDKPNFGTHVFTALVKDGSDQELRWIAVSMPPELPKVEPVKTRIELDRRGRKIEVPVKPAGKAPEPILSLRAKAALDLIEIAPDVVDRISEYVTPGASLIVSDHGLGHETGLYTDFIVVTR